MTNDDDLDDLLTATTATAPGTLADLDDPADEERAWSMVPGAEIHFLAPGLNVAQGSGTGVFSVATTRGMVVTLTADLIERNSDRFGDCWLALAEDEDAQVERWGRRMFAPGRPGPHFSKWVRGSVDAELERGRRLDEAHRIGNDAERAQAMADIRREFGAVRTSRSLASYDGGRLA